MPINSAGMSSVMQKRESVARSRGLAIAYEADPGRLSTPAFQKSIISSA